jgi:hypothetical protein
MLTPQNASQAQLEFWPDDGTLIGSFSYGRLPRLLCGSDRLPTGVRDLLQATSLGSGYWFDSLGNELKPVQFLGFATLMLLCGEPSANAVSEIVGELAGGPGTQLPTRPQQTSSATTVSSGWMFQSPVS